MSTTPTGWYPVYLPDHRYSPPIYRPYKYVWILENSVKKYSNNFQELYVEVALHGGHVYSTTSWQWNLFKLQKRNTEIIEQRFKAALRKIEKKAYK